MNKNDKTDRFFFVPASEVMRCCYCRHYLGYAQCKAFPERIPKEILFHIHKDYNHPEKLLESCNGKDDFHFEDSGVAWGD